MQWPSSWGDLHSDIAILTLTENTPSSIPRYPLHRGSETVGQAFVLAGYGNAGPGATGHDFGFDEEKPVKHAGRNRYEWVYTADVENGVSCL